MGIVSARHEVLPIHESSEPRKHWRIIMVHSMHTDRVIGTAKLSNFTMSWFHCTCSHTDPVWYLRGQWADGHPSSDDKSGGHEGESRTHRDWLVMVRRSRQCDPTPLGQKGVLIGEVSWFQSLIYTNRVLTVTCVLFIDVSCLSRCPTSLFLCVLTKVFHISFSCHREQWEWRPSDCRWSRSDWSHRCSSQRRHQTQPHANTGYGSIRSIYIHVSRPRGGIYAPGSIYVVSCSTALSVLIVHTYICLYIYVHVCESRTLGRVGRVG